MQALTFDFWNTLVVDRSGQLGELRRLAVASQLREAGLEVDDAELGEMLAAAGAIHEEAWRLGRAFEPREAAEHLAMALGPVGELHRERLVAAYLEAGAEADLELTPHASEVVTKLSQSGVKLGIVCDVGLTGSRYLRNFLARVGLLEHFDAWAFSDEVGAFKPSPIIFGHVLAGLRISASPEVGHVGDLKRTDVRGARSAGMRAIRYRGIFDDAGEGADADFVIDDLRDLMPIVHGHE